MKPIWISVVIFVSTICCVAQYTHSGSVTTVDSIEYGPCHTSSCFKNLPGHLDQISSSGSGAQIVGVNSSIHTAYRYNYSSKGWVQLAGGAVFRKVVAAAQDTYWVLLTTACGWGYQLDTYTLSTNTLTPYPASGTAWCLHDIDGAPDGTFWALGETTGGGYHTYVFDPSTGNLNPYAAGCTTIAAVDLMHAYCTNINNNIFYLDRYNNVNKLLPGAGVTISAGGSQVYIVGTNGVAFRYNGSGWDSYGSSVGTWTGVANGGPNRVFYINNATGDNIYRLWDQLAAVQVTSTGSYANYCNNLPNGCPIGSSHTTTVVAKFSSGGWHGAAGVSGSATGTPSSNLYASAIESSFTGSFTGCDLNFDPTNPACIPVGSDSATCTKMGALGVTPQGSSDVLEENCYAMYKLTGRDLTTCKWENGVFFCDYSVVPNCSNTTHPDFWVTGIRHEWVWIGDLAWGFETNPGQICYKYFPSDTWHHGFGDSGGLIDVHELFWAHSPVLCTYNP
jgi:hypothetical protein